MISRRRLLALAAAGLSRPAWPFVGGAAFFGSGGLAPSPDPTFSNVTFLMHGAAWPWYDAGNVGAGIANYGATVEGTIKPSWAAGSFFTGSGANHNNRARVIELGSNFQLGTTFCLDAWVYASTAGCRIFDTRPSVGSTSGFLFGLTPTNLFPQFECNNGGNSLTSAVGVTANTWTHVRTTYDGTTIRHYINGVLVASGASSFNITTGTHLNIANTNVDTTSGYANQYLADLRIVKGQALTTGPSFAPPSAAWPDNGNAIALQTNVTYANVVLRSNYDATVADQSNAARTMTANGGATISSPAKFGAGGLLLDGTGDYVTAADSADFDLGTGDYQIQAWVYRNGAKGNFEYALSCYTSATSGYTLGLNTSNLPVYFDHGDTGSIGFVDTVADTTWTHLAVGRKSGVTYSFVNGVLQRFSTLGTTADCSGTMFIGRFNNSFTAFDWKGSIDDIQLVKGECQLTRSFLVPAAALPTS